MKDIRSAFLLFVIFAALCGGMYPAVVTGVATLIFSGQAKGSFVADLDGRVVGSSLIGQPFTEAKYFWPRPSATAEFSYNPLASGGSNFGPSNPDFLRIVEERINMLHNSGVTGDIPADLVEASASGLDPDISPEAALLQLSRVAKARGMAEDELKSLVTAYTQDRQLGIFGAPRVNVLLLNLALDEMRQ